jgi:hypothetical protein
MDPTQVIITISVFLITVTVIFCAVYFVKLLSDLRLLLTKINPIVSDAGLISSSIAKPVSSISEFIMGFKNGFSIFNNLFPKEKENKN